MLGIFKAASGEFDFLNNYKTELEYNSLNIKKCFESALLHRHNKATTNFVGVCRFVVGSPPLVVCSDSTTKFVVPFVVPSNRLQWRVCSRLLV